MTPRLPSGRHAVAAGLAAVLFAVASRPASAEGPPPFPARCTPSACLWVAITTRDVAGRSPAGTLLRLATHTWTARAGDRTVRRPRRRDEDDSTAYAFCAAAAPAIIFRAGVEARVWIMYRLAPNDPHGIVDFNRASTRIYLAACHDRVDLADDAALVAAARGLGYAVAPDVIEPVEIDRPDSVLAP